MDDHDDQVVGLAGGDETKKKTETKKRQREVQSNPSQTTNIKTESDDTNTNNTNPQIVKGAWTPQEDEKLLSVVALRGAKKWNVIGLEVGTRTGKQCFERWKHHLCGTNKSPFTAEEIAIMSDAFTKFGPKHSKISKLLPGRSENQVKNYYHNIFSEEARLRKRGKLKDNVVNVKDDVNSESDAGGGDAVNGSDDVDADVDNGNSR